MIYTVVHQTIIHNVIAQQNNNFTCPSQQLYSVVAWYANIDVSE